MGTVFLNGEFLPQDKARISPLDRGFLFGDGIYEVIPVYKGKTFLLQEHLDRLHNSLSAIQLTSPLSDEQWLKVFERLIAENGLDQTLYMQITRGPAEKRTHQFPAQVTPTVFAMSGSPVKVKEQGIAAITAPDIRWKFCNIKSLNLLPNVLHRQAAEEADAEEAILIRDGYVTEGCLSNIFIVKDGLIASHPNEPGILPGITRQLLFQMAEELKIPCLERETTEDQLLNADEVWSTSVGREITPITSINGRPVNTGQPGPVWQKMYEHYQAIKARL